MVRTVLALLVVSLLAPSLGADAALASYGASQGCRVAGVPADVPDCRATQEGEAAFVGCDATTCTLLVSVASQASGLLPGEQAIESSIVADETTPLCSAVAVNPFIGSVACTGEAQVTVAVPGECRLFLVTTTGTADKLVKAAAFSEIRVCRDGSVTTA